MRRKIRFFDPAPHPQRGTFPNLCLPLPHEIDDELMLARINFERMVIWFLLF